MPPARLTGARRSERAPAYGTRTLYLLDTNHDTARARQARAVDKDVFDCRRIRAIPTSTEWPGLPRGRIGLTANSTSNGARGPTVEATEFHSSNL